MRIGDLLARQVAARPERVALVDAEEGRRVTWAELDDHVSSFAAHLADLGVERGGRVALWLPNGLRYVVAIFAIARRRALAVHVNTRFGAHEVGDLIERTRPTVLVTRADFAAVDFAGMLRTIPAEKLGSVRTVISAELPRAGGAADDSSPDDDALLFTTGGTTAKPKLVLHKQRSIAHHADVFAARTAMGEPGATLLAAVPFCGTFGNVALMGAIAGGAPVVTMSVFDERQADALIRQHRITHLVGDDKMIARLASVVEGGAAANARHTTVRFFGVAGFHPGATEAFARGAAAGLRPFAVYGSSEVQALYALGDPALLGAGAVTPVDDASIVRLGEGELLLGGPSLFDRYLDDPGATERAMSGGVFHTGDRARLEGAGPAFHFDGRLGDTLRLGGFLVSPAEIEEFLQGLAGVDQAQVVGVEHVGRIAAFAFVIAAPGEAVDEPALLAACRAKLARYKVPARIVPIDAYPTSNGPNGPKISRAELRVRAGTLLKGSVT